MVDASISDPTPEDVLLKVLSSPMGIRLLQEAMQPLLVQIVHKCPEPLMSVHDVAVFLGVSDRTIETLIAMGELRPTRVGGQRRFSRDAINAYVRRMTKASPTG